MYKTLFQGFISLFQFFFNKNKSLLHQVIDQRNDLALVNQVADRAHRQFFLRNQRLHDHDLPFIDVGRFQVGIGVEQDHRFAGQLEPGRQSGIHHLARRAHIVFRQPLPVPELDGQCNRPLIDQGKDIFRIERRGIMIKQLMNQCRIYLPFAKGYHYPLAGHDLIPELFRHPVGEIPGKRKRQQYIGVRSFQWLTFVED